jgi:LCP family protein required for cell wall assembly
MDADTGQTSMLSVPRDLYGAPLPDGREWDAKLNSLMALANADPVQFPLGGPATLKATMSELLDVPIHYFAAINIIGFKQAVDAIGGVDITNERLIDDPTYWNEFDVHTGFYLAPGTYHMDGSTAVAFARSRHGVGDSDFTRADRQQQLLAAIADKLTAGNLILSLPNLLDAVKNTIATDIPESRLPEMAAALQEADLSSLERAVIQPPLVTPATASDGAYILIPDIEGIRELAADLLGDGDTTASRH